MKKFLFTLATLLMAGSAFAGNVYIPDTEFTEDQIGTQVWLPVYIELDNEYMNGWDFTFTYPENLNVTPAIRKNNAVLTQTAVTDEFGTEENVAFTVNGNSEHNIGACIQGGYWDPDGDGEYELYGACKIGPTGTFMLFEIRVQPTAEFTGGNIEIEWMYSGGFDNRNGQTGIQLKGHTTVALTVATPPVDEKEECESPSIMGYADEDGVHYIIMITPDPNTDGQLQYTANPEPGAKATELVYTRGEEPFTVHVEAWTTEGATYKASDVETADITVPALDQVKTPSVFWAPNEAGSFDVWATCDTEDATIILTDGTETYEVEAGEHVTITYDPYEGYEGVWTATATKENMLDSETSEECEISINELPKVWYTAEPSIVVKDDPENQVVVVTVTGEDALHVDIVGGYNNISRDGRDEIVIEIPYGEEVDYVNIHATAVADLPEGYDEVVGNEATLLMVEIPKKDEVIPGEKPGVPEVKQVLTADNVTVSADATNADEVIMYLCTEEGEFILNDEGERIILENPSTIARTEETQTFYVLAVAINENGETWMDAPATVVIPGKTVTGIDELVNGKNVAGVRFFNMAGQEMQKVDGVTIVVTTYTDGTTSAVKVIK